MNGWTPAIVTFDAAGEVLSVTVSEPRFTSRERELLLASHRADVAPRGPHGHLMSEATDPNNRASFVADDPWTDFAQLALQRKQDSYYAHWPDAKTDQSLVWRVRQKD